MTKTEKNDFIRGTTINETATSNDIHQPILRGKDDLYLSEINNYYGTEHYHKIPLFSEFNLTDGIIYLISNGYSWFVTDALSVIKCDEKIRQEEFLSIKLKLANEMAFNIEDRKTKLIITDGNDNILYTQYYEFTDAKRQLNLFFTDGVLMLSGEY